MLAEFKNVAWCLCLAGCYNCAYSRLSGRVTICRASNINFCVSKSETYCIVNNYIVIVNAHFQFHSGWLTDNCLLVEEIKFLPISHIWELVFLEDLYLGARLTIGMLGVTLQWTTIPFRDEEKYSLSLCTTKTRDKHWPNGPLGLYVDKTLPLLHLML